MTNFDLLRDLPELAPEPGQADTALRLVHRRRRRAALRTAASACGLAVMALLLHAESPSTSLLEPTDKGVVQTATAVPSPTGHGGEADSATGPRFATGGSTAGSTATTPTWTGGTWTATVPPVPPSRSHQPPYLGREEAYRERYSNITNPMHISGGYTRGCSPTAGNGECTTATVEQEDGYALFVATMCSGTEPITLRFPTEQESDAVVSTKANVEQWRWGRGQTFREEPHTVVLGANECFAWNTPWNYTDEWGKRVPAGRYQFYVPILAEPIRYLGSLFDVP